MNKALYQGLPFRLPNELYKAYSGVLQKTHSHVTTFFN